MNTTNIRPGDLLICVNPNMKSYLKICKIEEINFIPHDYGIESVVINYNYGRNFNGCYKEQNISDIIFYKDFEYNFRKINSEIAY